MTARRAGKGACAGRVRLTIRPAVLADVPVVHDLAERSVTALLGRHYAPAQLAAAVTAQFYRVETDLISDGTYYVLEVDDKVVASSGWSHRGTFYPPGTSLSEDHRFDLGVATMRSTYVDPRWARRGLATLLARVTETAATMAGYTRFEALCSPLSEAMRQRLGYRLIERVTVPLVGDVSVTAALMRKVVDGAPADQGASEANGRSGAGGMTS